MKHRRKSTAPSARARKRPCAQCHQMVGRVELDKGGRCESCVVQLPLPIKIPAT